MPDNSQNHKTIKHFRSNAATQSNVSVDAENGALSAVKIIEVGEAIGHGTNIELSFLEDLVKFASGEKDGIKVRYDHPMYSGPGYGMFAGVSTNYRLDGNCVLADIQLSKKIGELANTEKYQYTLAMAQDHPNMMGMSISFKPGIPYQYDEDGKKISLEVETVEGDLVYNSNWDWSRKIYETFEHLYASDFVDDPAATTSLFNINSDQNTYLDYFKNANNKKNNMSKEIIKPTTEELSTFDKVRNWFKSNPAAPQTEAPAPSVKSTEEVLEQTETEKQFAAFQKRMDEQDAKMLAQEAKMSTLTNENTQLKATNKALQGEKIAKAKPNPNAQEESSIVAKSQSEFASKAEWAEAQKVKNKPLEEQNQADRDYARDMAKEKQSTQKPEDSA